MKGLVEGGETARAGAFYAVMSQHESRGIGLAIRSKGDLAATQAAVTRALAEIDPDVPMTDVFSMSARIDKSLNPRRAPMLLSLGFGVVALLLASIGLYGVLAYHVSQRTREIGIRMALGSDAGGIVRLILGEGGGLVWIGLAAGLAGAVALRGAIASQLYGVGALDPLVMAAAIGVLGRDVVRRLLGPGPAGGEGEPAGRAVAAVAAAEPGRRPGPCRRARPSGLGRLRLVLRVFVGVVGDHRAGERLEGHAVVGTAAAFLRPLLGLGGLLRLPVQLALPLLERIVDSRHRPKCATSWARGTPA